MIAALRQHWQRSSAREILEDLIAGICFAVICIGLLVGGLLLGP